MAKKKEDKVAEYFGTAIKDVEPKEPEPKTYDSDMWELYELVGERLMDEDVCVNADAPPEVEIQNNFVKDCMAMIPASVGLPPLRETYKFMARVTCVVPKGNDTRLRMDLLKDTVRAALMKEPFVIRGYTINTIVVDGANKRDTGVWTSELSLFMTVSK